MSFVKRKVKENTRKNGKSKRETLKVGEYELEADKWYPINSIL
jgi:hypothetical protein